TAAMLNAEGAAFHLAMVGSGAREVELRSLAQELGVANVHFHGFVNQSAIPRIYGACDIFVLPSENEPWGLAVNEAMCAGMPIIVSKEVGCRSDLLQEGENGASFMAGDVDGLAGALRSILVDQTL